LPAIGRANLLIWSGRGAGCPGSAGV